MHCLSTSHLQTASRATKGPQTRRGLPSKKACTSPKGGKGSQYRQLGMTPKDAEKVTAMIESSEEDSSESSLRPASLKRIKTAESPLAILSLPPPPDCPPYLQAEHLPVWVGRTPIELTAEKVDELHHIQWRAWKEGEGTSGEKDYGRIVETAGAIFNASFMKLNPHNFAITVGLTINAMYHLQHPPLACANTFLYGLSLLADNPSKQSIPIQFCKEAPEFMAEWAKYAFQGSDTEVIESLLEFCGVYPHSGLPDVLGTRVDAYLEVLIQQGKNKEALHLIRRLLQAPWAAEQKVWDEDIYWKLRLLSYVCKRRARLQEDSGIGMAAGSPISPTHRHGNLRRPRSPSSPSSTASTFSSSDRAAAGAVVLKMVVVVFKRSSGVLPDSLQEDAKVVECGLELSDDEVSVSLAAMRSSFALFSESFLALTDGAVRWELVYKPSYHLDNACMPGRPYHREVEAPTNPNRLVSQADVEACPEFRQFVDQGSREDEDIRTAQAIMVVWPGLRPASSYMLTCGGITPRGYGNRAVFMSDGAMLSGRPVWSPMWFHHEFFHIMEYCFPEAAFAEASQICGHPCFLRDQWPVYYEGEYEWDYYYHSYKTAILHPSVQPTLAARLARVPTEAHTHVFDVYKPETASIIARLAYPGDTIVLRLGSPSTNGASSSGHNNGNGHNMHSAGDQRLGGALGFKPGALPHGLRFVIDGQEEGRGGGEAEHTEAKAETQKIKQEQQQQQQPSFAAFWIPSPPCYLITLAKGGTPEAHEKLLISLLDDSSHEKNGRQQPKKQATPPPHQPLLPQWPAQALTTDTFVDYAAQQVEACIAQNRCTYVATGSSWMDQKYYICKTCREFSTNNGNVGCCLSCARQCHVGHELEERPPARFYCDCGMGGFSNLKCRCCSPPGATMSAAAISGASSPRQDDDGNLNVMMNVSISSSIPPPTAALANGHNLHNHHSHHHGH